jgi:outer membrane lipoprotein carrier protein
MLKTVIFISLVLGGFDQGGLVERIAERYENVHSMHARLTQVYRWAGFDATQAFEGEIWLKRPDKVRLRLTDDQENHIIACADTTWLYTPGLNQAILTHHPSEVLLEIFNFDHYETTVRIDEEYIVVMFPKEDNPYFQKITLHVKRDGLLIQQMTVTDPNDNETEWLFDEIEVNPELPDSLFHFSPPDGVEVIEQ